MIKALIFDLCDTVVRTAGLPGLAHLPGVADADIFEPHPETIYSWNV